MGFELNPQVKLLTGHLKMDSHVKIAQGNKLRVETLQCSSDLPYLSLMVALFVVDARHPPCHLLYVLSLARTLEYQHTHASCVQ